MARMLITGGAGFIGSNLAEELLEKGHAVKILDNFTTGRKENIDAIRGRIEVINGNVKELDDVKKAVENIDYVFHLAALVSVPMSIKNPLLTEEVNTIGTLNVLKASRDSGVNRVVYASSCAVYGDIQDIPIKEDTQKEPLSPYALTKLSAEGGCRLFSKLYGLETVCLRYFNVYGPKQDPNSQYAAVIPRFIESMLQNGQPVIFGDGEQTRDFVFVRDVIQANMLATSTRGISGQVFNIGSGKAETINSLLGMVNRILAKQIKPGYAQPRHGDIRHSLADIGRAREQLGYSPGYSFPDGLQETIQWFKGREQDD